MLLFESLKALDFHLFAIAFVNFPSYNKRIENESLHFRYCISQVRVSESYGLKFPREFALLMKQLLYFDRYTRLLAPSMNMLRDERINISTNRQLRRTDRFQ
jgi:predicted unusual protein kinase regulating ubiquinone biosynthesis (AarF/ABC1/UbiB family)